MNSEWGDGGKPGGKKNNFVHQIVCGELCATSLPSQLLSRICISELGHLHKSREMPVCDFQGVGLRTLPPPTSALA